MEHLVDIIWSTTISSSAVVVRRVWETYLPVADVVIFLVDGTDRKRLPEAKAELDVSILAKLAYCLTCTF